MRVLPRLGMYTRLTGRALNGSVVLLDPVGQSCFGLGGEHHLAVHARRQTTGVALGHPPHAQKRVGARPQHQLLQAADPVQVPRLRRREDPLPQPPYAHPRPAASRLAPVEGRVLWSVHHDRRPWRPTCPRVPGLWSSFSSQAHLTASAPFRAGAPGPGIRPVIRNDRLEGRPSCPGFPLPFGCRHFASRSSCSRRGVGPSLRSAYRAQGPDLDGVTAFRTHELRPGWVPSLPRGRRCSSRPSRVLDRRLPLSAASPCTPLPASHRAGLRFTRHQRGFKQFTRPAFPSPVAARMERAALGLCPELRTPPTRSRRRTSRWGQAIEHGPGTTRSTSHRLILQSCSSLTACDLASHDDREKRVCRQGRDDRYAWPSDNRVTEVAATLGTVEHLRKT